MAKRVWVDLCVFCGLNVYVVEHVPDLRTDTAGIGLALVGGAASLLLYNSCIWKATFTRRSIFSSF